MGIPATPPRQLNPHTLKPILRPVDDATYRAIVELAEALEDDPFTVVEQLGFNGKEFLSFNSAITRLRRGEFWVEAFDCYQIPYGMWDLNTEIIGLPEFLPAVRCSEKDRLRHPGLLGKLDGKCIRMGRKPVVFPKAGPGTPMTK